MAALELALDPKDAARLPRLPEFARLRAGRARASAAELVWYDTPEGTLAEAGLSLCERRIGRETLWRLERTAGPPGQPAPLVAEAPLPAGLAGLSPPLPSPLLPVAAFSGEMRSYPVAAPAGVALLHGAFRAVAGERPACRLLLSGAAEDVQPLALAAALGLRVPDVTLAAEAYEVASRPAPPRALGAPELPPELSVADAFGHVAGHLTGVLLHWAPFAQAGEAAEPVHQMRVALRRLRSAIKLFRHAVGCPQLDAMQAELRALGRVLGPARDWDVFAAGTGRAIGEAFADEPAVTRLRAAAERRRLAAYAALRAYLDGAAFRRLGLLLACLLAFRPWERVVPADAGEAEKQADQLAAPLVEFAARALSRGLERVLEPGEDLSHLPPAALHAIRIQGKRLRYAAEFFAPLFPRKETRRFLHRIGAVQERLGHLNDGTVAEALMAQLGGGGSERALAVGIVRGFVAAGQRDERVKSDRAWRKLRRQEPFWK